MPSSGYPIESFEHLTNEGTDIMWKVIYENAKHAMNNGLFIEWLESFVGAYNHIKNKENLERIRNKQSPYTSGEAANIASQCGIIEWDL